MDTPTLKASTRSIIGKQVKQLRRDGKLPGVLYGHDTKNISIAMDSLDYEKTFKKAGTSTLVELSIDDDKPVKVLLHEPQIHPAKPQILHADFYAVKMNEKLQTEIPLHFVGEAEAVTVLDGTLNENIDTVTVECFPDKLVPAIEVDITSLKTLDDIIRISDIVAPEGIEILADPEEAVATIIPPRSEAELEALEEGPATDEEAVAQLEVTEEKKPEEEASE